MAAYTCAWKDGATVAASIYKDDVVTDVDAVAGANTEDEAVVPARSNNAFLISNYRLQIVSLLETRGGFLTLPLYAA